ncbi:MAG TPA: cell division protein FtsQ/DivIB [Balneolaceae bacterium]
MNQNESHNESEPKKAKAVKGKSALSWIAGAVLILAIGVSAGFYWNSTVTVQEVSFEGNYFVSTEQLQKIDVPLGMHPDSMNFLNIMHRFKEIPYVKRVKIKVQPSGNLLIEVIERQPVALLSDGEYKIYVDEDGRRLPIILGKAVNVPILYGFSARPMDDTLESEAFKTMAKFLTEISKNPASNATISEVAWTDEKGVIALTNQNGVKLIFGKGDFATRLRNWEAFYGKVIKQKGIESMQTVDLRFKGQIVTREN